MPESIYKFIELVGTSDKSWEQAMRNIIEKASKTLRDLRIAEVLTQDVKIDENKVALFRVKAKLSFRFED